MALVMQHKLSVKKERSEKGFQNLHSLLFPSFHTPLYKMSETGNEDTNETPFFKYHHLKAIQDVSLQEGHKYGRINLT